jgi:hypothetical protein
MSDTPETDAEKFFSDHHGYHIVHAEHAEDLERERDEWKEAAEGSLLGAIKERDALRNELNFTIRLSRTWEDDVKNISADRDYWKAEAERWRGLSQESVDEVAFDDQTAPYGEWWEVEK